MKPIKILSVSVLLFNCLSSCQEESLLEPVTPRNETCINGKCINLREGFITVLNSPSNSNITTFQVDLTNGSDGVYADRIRLIFYSTNSAQLVPGKYDWNEANRYVPQSVIYAYMTDVTVENVNLTGYSNTVHYDNYSANQGSVTVSNKNGFTILLISLTANSSSMSGYFEGVLKIK